MSRLDRVGDFTIFVCGNSRLSVGPCDTPGCHKPHACLCDYQVKKRVRGVVIDKATCDRKLCAGCAHPQPYAPGDLPVHYCRVHHEMAQKTTAVAR